MKHPDNVAPCWQAGGIELGILGTIRSLEKDRGDRIVKTGISTRLGRATPCECGVGLAP
jgi:hypothetical protein